MPFTRRPIPTNGDNNNNNNKYGHHDTNHLEKPALNNVTLVTSPGNKTLITSTRQYQETINMLAKHRALAAQAAATDISKTGVGGESRTAPGGEGEASSCRSPSGNQQRETTSNAEFSQQPICDRFGFIVGDKEDVAANMRSFLNGDLGDDKQSREQALAKVLKRERKWLDMIDNWDEWILSKRFKHTRKRCRKGIPSAVRGKAWFYLSGGHISLAKYSKFYDKLEREPGDQQVCDEIRRDIHRQFPNHELFREANGPGQQSLFTVLKCLSIVRKEISYCQGLAPVASILLMNMPPSHAFWSLVAITDHYVPGYYLPGFQAVQLHGRMLFALLKEHAPVAYRILKKSNIDPVLYALEWFMCLFVRNLPWASVLRIWDMFLCEGIVVIFKAAIVIVATTLTSAHKKTDEHDILQLLKNVPESQLQESVFIPKVLELNLTDKHLKRKHSGQLRKKAKSR